MKPADEIRKAVEILRCDHSWPINPPGGTVFTPGRCVHCGIPWRAGSLVADELIEPLAAWLDETRTAAGRDAIAGRPFAWHRALAVARAIRGGDGS